MSETVTVRKKLFATLDREAYQRAPAPSRDDVRAALKKGSADLRMASAQPRAVGIDPKRRYR